MKKLFAMAALVTFFTACNNGSEEKKVEVTKDSANSESPLIDAVNTQDSVTKKIEDSTHHMMDTMMKK